MVRPHYFAGRGPGLDDLAREQQYLLQRLRRHNRWAHGWGVLQGLAVSVAGDELLVSPAWPSTARAMSWRCRRPSA